MKTYRRNMLPEMVIVALSGYDELYRHDLRLV